MVENSPLVSVIISAYNAEIFIRETLDALLCQTYHNFEIIAVDDCSTDTTGAILDDYAQKDKRIIVVHNQTNLKAAKSKNLGIELAKGKYIAINDADDISLPNRLEEQVKFLEAHPDYSFVSCCVQGFYDHSNPTGIGMFTTVEDLENQSNFISPDGDYEKTYWLIKKNMISGNRFCHSSMMGRAAAYKALKYKFVFAEDWELWNRALLNGYKMTKLPMVLLRYRIVNSGMCGVFDAQAAPEKAKEWHRLYLLILKAALGAGDYVFFAKFLFIYYVWPGITKHLYPVISFARRQLRPIKRLLRTIKQFIKMELFAIKHVGSLKKSFDKINETYLRKSSGPPILLTSHELSGSGAPRVLYYAAKHLREAGNFPVVASPTDGPLRPMFESLGIPVLVSPLLLTRHLSVLKFARHFDCIIANSLVSWPIIYQMQQSNTNIPVFWYLHESNDIAELVKHIPLVGIALKNAANILAVSPRAARFVAPFNANPKILPYGVPDMAGVGATREATEEPIVFSIVGSLERHKGQDIFIKAAIELEKKAPGTAQFNIIGRAPDMLWAAQLKAMAFGHENIRFMGELDFNTCLHTMQSSDIIVCPSRHDSLPMVVTDGLCMGKPVICSDATGHADFITPGVDGMIIRSESVEDLVDAMHQLLQNPTLRKDMGAAGRKTFLRHFSEQVFAERINDLVGTVINSPTVISEKKVSQL